VVAAHHEWPEQAKLHRDSHPAVVTPHPLRCQGS
jgi:hypothetical protein